MDPIQAANFIREWKELGLLIIAVITLWRKNENLEKRIASLVDEQTAMIRESVKHIERSTTIMERLERDGGR